MTTRQQYKLVDESKVSQHLYCSVCRQLFQTPSRLSLCGHTFCQECITSQKTKQQRKPSGKEVFKCQFPGCAKPTGSKIQKDILATRLIDQLAVQCVNEHCMWKGTLVQYREHRNQCKLGDGLSNFLSKLRGIRSETISMLNKYQGRQSQQAQTAAASSADRSQQKENNQDNHDINSRSREEKQNEKSEHLKEAQDSTKGSEWTETFTSNGLRFRIFPDGDAPRAQVKYYNQ